MSTFSSTGNSSNAFDPSSLFSAEGLVVVVTGGGTGIGLVMATALENNGATVYIVGRRREVLEKAAKEKAKFGKIIPLQGDVTSRESLLSMVSAIESQVGHINLLINNCGIQGPESVISQDQATDVKAVRDILWNTPHEEFLQTFNVNVASVFYTTIAFLELLDKGNKRGGIPGVTSQVITVSSIAGFRRDGTMAGIAYTTSKAATNHLGKVMSNLLMGFKIRSNVIVPGIYPSEMQEAYCKARSITPSSLNSATPLGRIGTDEDMGGVVLYLATRAGGYVSGNLTITDGGRVGLFPSTY